MSETIERYLLLPCRLAMRIQLAELERPEQLLDRRAGVAVGRGVDDFEAQPLQMLFRLRTRMITGAIEQEDDVVAPRGRVLVQQTNQMLEKQQHDVAVGVGLRQREPYSAVCIDRCDK